MLPLITRELRLAAQRPGSWLVAAGTLLGCGLFLCLRLAAGEGGDLGGYLREAGAVLLPAGALLGAAALAPSPRQRLYLRGPWDAGSVTLGLMAPALLTGALLAAACAHLPLVNATRAPVDPGVLRAGAVALAGVSGAAACLGAAGAAWLGHGGAGALAGFLVALALWGAGGLGQALGWPWLRAFSLQAVLLPAGGGWVSLPELVTPLVVGLGALALAREALEAGRR